MKLELDLRLDRGELVEATNLDEEQAKALTGFHVQSMVHDRDHDFLLIIAKKSNILKDGEEEALADAVVELLTGFNDSIYRGIQPPEGSMSNGHKTEDATDGPAVRPA